jgi:dTDP-4-dehydrorhamnose reductase
MKRVLVTGSEGFLGSHIAHALRFNGFTVIGTRREGAAATQSSLYEIVTLDLSHASFIESIDRVSPDAVIHAAAMADIRACEQQPDLARAVNVEATAALAEWCRSRRARFVFISTDQVFDGGRSWYREDDAPNPIHVYGRTKADAEAAIDTLDSHNMIARVSLVYGGSPSGKRSATEQIIGMLRAGQQPQLFTDEFRTPILAEDVASAIVELMHMKSLPIMHLAGPDRVSRHELGNMVARAFRLDASLIVGCRQDDVVLQPPRPKDLSLDTTLARRVLRRPPRCLSDGLIALTNHQPA